jgi:hypothetical protein
MTERPAGERLEWLAATGVAMVVLAMAGGVVSALLHRGLRGLAHLNSVEIRYLATGTRPGAALVLLLCVVVALFAGSDEALSVASRWAMWGAKVAAPVLIAGAALAEHDQWHVLALRRVRILERLDVVLVNWMVVVVAAAAAGLLAALSLGAAGAGEGPAGPFFHLRGRWRDTV